MVYRSSYGFGYGYSSSHGLGYGKGSGYVLCYGKGSGYGFVTDDDRIYQLVKNCKDRKF